MAGKRLTAKETLAVIVERINNLIKRFDRFDDTQEQMFENMLKNQRGINDLSHVVKAHQDFIDEAKEKVKTVIEDKKADLIINKKWILGIMSAVVGMALYIVRDIVIKRMSG